LIKIIETGRASARILGDESEKQSMLQDWSKLDMEEIVNREIPCSDENIELLTQFLKDDVSRLLDKNSNDESDPNMTIMTRASDFISELPGKFPNTNPRLFILLTSNLLTTCLREISLSGGQGFGAWWIVRCWVDELLAWNFELGGFLQDDFNNEGEFEITEKSTDMDTSRPMPQNMVQEEEHQSTFESSNAEGNHDRANTSLGTVDLLDISYGHEQSNTTGGNFASAVAAATNDIVLNYENSVDNILG
jgi:regulatory factor X